MLIVTDVMVVDIIMIQTHQMITAFKQEHISPVILMTGCCLGVKYKQRELTEMQAKWL